jgi:hypothetical protein
MLDELILTLFENLDPDRQDELQKSGIMDDWSTIEKTVRVIDEILKSEWCLTEGRQIRRKRHPVCGSQRRFPLDSVNEGVLIVSCFTSQLENTHEKAAVCGSRRCRILASSGSARHIEPGHP